MVRFRWFGWSGALAAGWVVAAALAGEPTGPKECVPGYVGSDACASCHEKVFRDWKDSLHSRMEQPATKATVRGKFTPEGTVVATEAPDRRIVLSLKDGRYFIEAPGPEGKPVVYPIERTIGNRYKQRYLTRFADGSLRALPVQWFERDQKFVEWNKLASSTPGSGIFWADGAWQWQLKCAGCHTTGLDLRYDSEKKTYDTRFQELAIGCEACHGPGKAHVDAKGGTGNILCPSKFTLKQQDETCGKCHSRGTAGPEQGAPKGLPGRLAYPYNMVPGTALDAALVQVTPEKDHHEFWDDGSSKNHHQQLTDWRLSGMHKHGGDKAPSCTACHEPHRAAELRATIEDNALCVRCHATLQEKEALAKHTGHGGDPAANPGNRCVECHMPRIVTHAGSQKLRSHTFWGSNPKRSLDTKTPDACLLCHKDKDAAWSIEAARRIWPSAK